ncbi:hypothetical protein C8R45DRAFT_930616 [Mycena sanguinolenta]|nr:hypothetical protein C8R45DRAFT_930616 [Mycena sanguinolenta]
MNQAMKMVYVWLVSIWRGDSREAVAMKRLEEETTRPQEKHVWDSCLPYDTASQHVQITATPERRNIFAWVRRCNKLAQVSRLAYLHGLVPRSPVQCSCLEVRWNIFLTPKIQLIKFYESGAVATAVTAVPLPVPSRRELGNLNDGPSRDGFGVHNGAFLAELSDKEVRKRILERDALEFQESWLMLGQALNQIRIARANEANLAGHRPWRASRSIEHQ